MILASFSAAKSTLGSVILGEKIVDCKMVGAVDVLAGEAYGMTTAGFPCVDAALPPVCAGPVGLVNTLVGVFVVTVAARGMGKVELANALGMGSVEVVVGARGMGGGLLVCNGVSGGGAVGCGRGWNSRGDMAWICVVRCCDVAGGMDP